MAAQAKPDSSYASNRMTKSNPPPKHLLSTFNRTEPEETNVDFATINKEAGQTSIEEKPEIDTDAEPLSSDEEAEGSKLDVTQSSIEKKAEVDTDAGPLSSDQEKVEDPLSDIAQPSIENKLEIDTDAEPLSSDEEEAEGSKLDVTQPSIEKKTEVDTDAGPLSSDQEEVGDPMSGIAQPSIENKLEIDTDAEPLSSDEEEAEGSKLDVTQPSIEKKTEVDTDAGPLSSDQEEVGDPMSGIAQPSIENKLEIYTDAEPLSSDEEEAEGPDPDLHVTQPSIEKKAEIVTDAEPLSSDQEEVEDPMSDIAQPSIENKLEIDTDIEPLSSPPLSSPPPSSPPLSWNEEESEDPISNAAQPSIKKGWDIDTDADPLSSDEEQVSDSDASPYRKEVNYTTTTLEEKLAEANNRTYSSPQTHSQNSRKGEFSRNLSAMMGSDSDDLFSFSSQSHKRRKATKYASVSKTSYFNRPSFPPRPVEKSKEPSPVKEAPKEPEETFIMPKDVESSSFREPRGGEDSNSSFSHGPYTMEEYEAMLLDDDSPLSSPTSSTCEQMSQLDRFTTKEKRQPSPPRPALCPICRKEVDWASLELFRAKPKQRIREQVMFCESHKLRSAVDLWRDRGYPNIDWEGFEERIQSYFPELEKLLVPGAFSYYRNILSTSIAPGKARNFRVRVDDDKTLETMTCGYYGGRGATKILETIICRFSVVVRRLATTDELIKTAGVAGYTQSVLVPELAVLMVKDDMKVNDEEARRIMRESMDIGARVHPDLNIVPIQEDVEES